MSQKTKTNKQTNKKNLCKFETSLDYIFSRYEASLSYAVRIRQSENRLKVVYIELV